MEAIKIYEELSRPPRDALRQITDGNLKGKTDINPQWRYKAMTEKFGLVGLGWKYEIQKLWTEKGAGNEVLAFAQVAVFVRDPETKEWSDPIVGIGGSKLINDFQRGAKSNDEGYKMAVTDAFSTSLKMIGVAADIYAGRWDGSKYSDEPQETGGVPGPQGPAAAKPQGPAAAKPQGPAGGQDTPNEHKRINDLLSRTYPDGQKMFTAGDCQGIPSLRMTKTAAEVIQTLNEEIHTRLEAWNEAHTELPPDTPVEQIPGYYDTPAQQTKEDINNDFDVF